MGEPAFKLEKEYQEIIEQVESYIRDTHTEEIIIGLCGPIGTDVSFVADMIKKVVERDYDYIGKLITLSTFIKEQYNEIDFEGLKKTPCEYYTKLIDCGDDLRELHSNSVLAKLAINDITVQREIDKKGTDEFTSKRRCYIIDSIKNGEELELFRLVYREIFYFVGVFTTIENRKKNLSDKRIKTEDVIRLIERDNGEEKSFGQKVSDTFIESDFFLRLDKSTYSTVEIKVRRFLNLIFNSDIITPSIHENAMYLAAAAAGNSACLSRQVGAAITDENGEMISIGWNDVPKFGGSVYHYNENDPISSQDHRCMHLQGGICFNDKEKENISELLINELLSQGVISEDKKEKLAYVIEKSKISELIEFSRAVHAEMLAIIHGTQKAGQKMRNGKLYCTTYPCHNCARHIVAAGIKEVYYIEPYKKSLAIKLHSDSITEDESKNDHVKILMFEGVSPRRYLELFRMSADSRKNKGKRPILSTRIQKPKKTLTLQAIPILEKKITEDLISRNLIPHQLNS